MDSSFTQRLNSLITSCEAYLEQTRHETPLQPQVSLLTQHTFEAPKAPTPPAPIPAPVIAPPKPLAAKPEKPAIQPEPVTPIAPVSAQAQEPIKQPPKDLGFSLNKPAMGLKQQDDDIRTLLGKISPQILAQRPIPSDAKAQQIKNGWKEKYALPVIPILASSVDTLPFLHSVAEAITLHFFPSKALLISELEKQGMLSSLVEAPHIKLIISPDITLWNCKELMKHYQEIPQQKQRFLKSIPLLLLPDPSLYLKDPSLKRSLWNLLCHLLKPLQS